MNNKYNRYINHFNWVIPNVPICNSNRQSNKVYSSLVMPWIKLSFGPHRQFFCLRGTASLEIIQFWVVSCPGPIIWPLTIHNPHWWHRFRLVVLPQLLQGLITSKIKCMQNLVIIWFNKPRRVQFDCYTGFHTLN